MDAVEAIRAGEPVLLPTDTVYGLACAADRAEPVHRMYALKGRAAAQPTALLAASVDALLGLVPELDERARAIARALLPGPFTLVLPNPARRFPWLTGARPWTIGVRVAALPEPAQRVLDAVVSVAATSANEAGGRDPAALDEVPEGVRRRCAAEIDAGRLPGTPSTVVDLTRADPLVLREGAVSATETLARIAHALDR